MPPKQKLNKADFMFKSRKGETLIKKPGMINGIDFMIKDLQDCTVYILDHSAQIQMDRCTNTKVYIGPIRGSIFVRDCKDCEITVACSQFRCRDLYDSKVYLFVGNEPVIESSKNVAFAPYNMGYPLLDKHAEAAKLEVNVNKWDLVFDFTKQESGELNYSIIDPKDWKFHEVPVEGMEEKPVCGFPYPVRYGGTIPDDAYFGEVKEEGGMMSFAIDTKANDAAKEVKKKEIKEACKLATREPPKHPVNQSSSTGVGLSGSSVGK